MAYRKGVEVFVPIYRTGEYGRIRFKDKKTLEIKYINSATGKVYKADTFDQTPELSIKTDKRRKIGRSGLAKQSWTRLMQRMATGGITNAMGVPYLGTVQWRGSSEVAIMNRLKYIRKALQGGESAVSQAALSASRYLSTRIDQQLAKMKGVVWQK
jgi:hypothetical protein